MAERAWSHTAEFPVCTTLKAVLQSDELADELGRNARREYLLRYTPERNLRELMKIYRFAMDRRGCQPPADVVGLLQDATTGYARPRV
jgi:hypothetical protein